MQVMTEKRQELRRRADVLKQYEVYGYQVAYYLLDNETLAAEAVSQAFIELLRDGRFFDQPNPLQKQQLKQILMKQSVTIKIAAMQEAVSKGHEAT
ncbi:hypothetical protein [Paenibacillus arenilitoris]|uniref:Uncharacterized protein n=1 Tax=Paenibacillus arenilitoris TaxID=2772299 RepID=A0A927CQY2_9BACL|nr:hypothetical protein [Paenibacillus arenilitoris]MBD2870621.1 hypothetical protein [Paenibacillus arenilitoris]